jgi:hypothetical protein
VKDKQMSEEKMFKPLWLDHVEVPRDRATMNAWFRSVYLMNPNINEEIAGYRAGIVINIKETQIPSTDVDLMVDDLLVLGEVFFHVQNGAVHIQNPDYVTVNRNREMFLRPDTSLLKSLDEKSPADQEYIDAIKAGKNFPMAGKPFFHIARLVSPYDLRGTSIFAPYLQSIAANETFTLFPSGPLAIDVFRNKCLHYSNLVNQCFDRVIRQCF